MAVGAVDRWQWRRPPQPRRHPGDGSHRYQPLSVHLMDRLMLPQVRHPPKTLPTFRARKVIPGTDLRALLQFGSVFVRSRFVPSTMRGEIRRTIKDFIAFGTTVLHMYNSGATMLGQTKCILIQFPTKSAHIIANVIFDFCQFRFRFLRHLDHIECRIDVAFSHHKCLIRSQFAYDGPRYRGTVVFIEIQFSGDFRTFRHRCWFLLNWHLGSGGWSLILRTGCTWGCYGRLIFHTQVQWTSCQFQWFRISQILL